MSRRPNMTAAVAAVACAVAMVLAGVAPGSTGGLEAAQADTQPADYPLLGTHYFPPWSDTCSTEYLYGGHSTNQWVRLQQYGGDTRRPAEPLGWYKSNTDVAVIDQQLQWMAEAGIDFAAFGWMLNGGEISCMDRVVQAYLDSPNSENVGFAINWIAETDWDRVKTLTAWDRTIAYWIENYFSRPQYLRIGGRPVLMIYNLQMLEADADAIYAADDLPTEQRVKKLLERARSKAAAAGLGGLYIVGQQAPYWRNQPTIEYADRVGLDALSAYNYGPPSNNNALDYAGLDAAYRAKWKDSVLRQVAVSGRVAYWPPMTVGWDDTPIRLSQGETPRLGNATITQFENHLMAGRDFLNNYPVQTGGVAMLAAWNEYEEGSVIEPSASQPPGERYIDAIRRVFAQDPPPSTPSLSAATLNSGANASATRIAVTSNAQWTATNPSGAQWLGIAPTVGTPGGAMTLSVKANQTLQPRRAKVEVRVGTGRPAVIEVTQAANPEATMVGRMEVVSSPAPGTVALHMWVYDPRAMNESVDVDLYVGGRKDEVGAHRYPLGTTDVLRYDIIDAYGLDVPFPRWGFSEKTVDVDDAGTNVEVCAYASPVGTANPQGGSVLLNCLTVTKIEPATRPASADTSSASVTHRPGQVANYSAQGDEWGSQTVSVELVDQAARPVTGAVGKLTIGPGSRDAWLGAGLGYSNGGSFQCAQTPEPDGRCPAGVYEIGVYSAQVGTRILQANYADGGVSFQVGRKGEAGQRDLEAVFVAGALSEAETLGSLTASAGAVATADGKTAHTAELTVADAYGHGLSGIEVLFELEATKSALFPNGLSTISSRSSADGVVSVTFTDTLGEAVQLTIKIDGQVIARLGFTFSSPPPVGETEPPPTDDPQNDPPPGGTSPNDLPQGGASHGNTSRPEQTPPSDGSTTSATPPASSTPGLTPNPAPARPGPDAGSGAAPSADALTAVGVSQKRIRLTKGAKVRPLAVVYKTDSAKLGRMVWVSSRPSVVKVNRRTGRTLGVSLGKATVTGTSVEKTATGRHLTVKVIVTVVPNRTAVKSLAAAVPKAMKTGAIKVLNARSSPARATGVEFRFHSTNPKVATVDPAGRLTAKRPGTARIQIRAGGKVRTYRITVK